MNIKKLFIGAITGGIVYFFLGWLAYGKLLVDYFNKHHGLTTGYMRDPAVMPLPVYLVLGNLLMGFLLTYIFLKAKVSSFGNGFVTGGIIGFLMTGAADLVMYSTTTLMSRQGVLADVIAFTVMSAIAGAITGAVIGSGKEN